jgi:hypothetical protein
MKTRFGRRGSVLLLVVVLLAVISLLAAAAVTFSQSELGAAKNERIGDELLACADVGRQYLLSRVQLGQSAKVINVDMNMAGEEECPKTADVPKGKRCVRSGHIGQLDNEGFLPVGNKAGGNREDMRDITNSAGDPTFNGVPHKIVVHCKDESGRETEVEFVVRFGL